jgi:hypothetical protein
MATVYVVLENGDLYPNIYSTYESAREAVITKYTDELQSEREEFEEWGRAYYKSLDNPEDGMPSKVNIDENESGTTLLYIEKGIHITIQRYSVPK